MWNWFGVYIHHIFVCSTSNQKIIGISALSRRQHNTAQAREYESTKVVLPKVLARGEVCGVLCSVYTVNKILPVSIYE